MVPALVVKTWRDDRRAIIGWSVGIAAFTTLYTGFYSQFQGTAELKEDALPPDMLEFLGIADMTSAIGYLQATIYSLIGPLLVIMGAITLTTRTIARPEEDGGMELLLANPLTRRAFATQRLTAAATAITTITAVPWLLVAILAPIVDMNVPQGNIAATNAGLILLVWCFAGIAFLIGAWTGRRTPVLVVTGTLAVATYLANAISGLLDGGDWLKWLSPFHYFIGTDPLRTGWHPAHLAVLAAIAVVTAVAGIRVFDRRDIGV